MFINCSSSLISLIPRYNLLIEFLIEKLEIKSSYIIHRMHFYCWLNPSSISWRVLFLVSGNATYSTIVPTRATPAYTKSTPDISITALKSTNVLTTMKKQMKLKHDVNPELNPRVACCNISPCNTHGRGNSPTLTKQI